MVASSALTPNPAGKSTQAVRVLVVDDSAVIRGLISRWLEEDPGITVAGSAVNGRHAVTIAQEKPFDVAILDIEMPEMDGLTALPLLVKAQPGLKVLMASTLTRRNAEISLKAMSLGAADYVPKPETMRDGKSPAEFRTELIEKVKALGTPAASKRAPGIVPRTATRTLASAAPAKITLRAPSAVKPQVIAIGSSTGGPQALFEVVKVLAPALDLPVVITQHMPAAFTAILAEHIRKASGLACAEGKTGDVLKPRQVYVAPGGQHMLVERRNGQPTIVLSDAPPENYCKPAVDPMFRSLAAAYGSGVLGIILTGMGQDGREGGRAIVGAGGTILAQDEATSVVWGMPGAVAQAGLCSAVVPLAQIVPEVLKLTRRTP